MNTRSTVAALALGTVGALVAGLSYAPLGWSQSAVEEYLDKMSRAESSSYVARRLVVYLATPQAAAVLEERSSPQGTFVRSDAGSETTRLWFAADHVLVSDDESSISDAAPANVGVRTEAVMQKYEVRAEPAESLLGVDVVPLELVRRTDRKLVERLWVHPESGVVYRRELYGADGALVGLSTILDMKWGESSARMETPDGPPVKKAKQTTGSRAPAELAYGYALVKAYAIEAHGRPTEHWVYSDGMHTLSVFRTKGTLDRPDGFEKVSFEGGSVWAGPGPGTFTWEGDGHTWTLVAEETQLAPAKLTGDFPRGGRSLPARLGSWWARAFRWVGDRF